jgi:hypothetical protein
MSYERFVGGLGQDAPRTTLRVSAAQKPSLQVYYAGKVAEIKNQIAMYESGGPYYLLEFNSADYSSFMRWMQMYYEQDMAKRQSIASLRPVPQAVLDNIKKETGEDVVVPDWMKTGIKIPESEWRLFVECRDRAMKMVREQGAMPAAVDARGFAEWWKKHDNCGFSGFFATASYGEQLAVTGVPSGLYNFYLQTKGSRPPPANLLGKGSDILSWVKQNWMMLGLGAVGGIVVVGVLKKRREMAKLSAAQVGIARNVKRSKSLKPVSFMSSGVRSAIDPYGEGEWEEVWDPDTKRYVVAPFGGVRKPQGPRTKREMRAMGYKYDLYTGEKL